MDLHDFVTPNDASTTQTSSPSSTSTPTLSSLADAMQATTPASPSHCDVHVMNYDRDADNPTVPPEHRKNRRHTSYNTTSTTLHRLFAACSPFSPESSRTTSYTTQSSIQKSMAQLPEHLYSQGFMAGKYSDVTIVVFGTRYKLHRIVLDRSPFFASAFSGPWSESKAQEVTLHPEEIDPDITKAAFELALKRLYGCPDQAEEELEAIGLVATGSWLEMRDLVSSSVDILLKAMDTSNLARLVNLVTSNYYGQTGERIIFAAKALLSRDGWAIPTKSWDGIPATLVRDIISGDSLFVPSEFDRFTLARKILDRRLKTVSRERRPPTASDSNTSSRETSSSSLEEASSTKLRIYDHPEVAPVIEALEHGIYYIHMRFEQLQTIKSTTDYFGNPVVSRKHISDALWTSMELRQKITQTSAHNLEVMLSEAAAPPRNLDDIPDEKSPRSAPGGSSRPKGRRRLSSKSKVPTNSSSSTESELHTRYWIPQKNVNVILGGLKDDFTRRVVSESSRLEAEVGSTENTPAPLLSFSTAHPKLSPQSPGEDAGVAYYTNYPPFRFSVEFSNLKLLQNNRRMHSETFFYAGSLWNVYILKKSRRLKAAQVGVYLQRIQAKSEEDISRAMYNVSSGFVDERIGSLERSIFGDGPPPHYYNPPLGYGLGSSRSYVDRRSYQLPGSYEYEGWSSDMEGPVSPMSTASAALYQPDSYRSRLPTNLSPFLAGHRQRVVVNPNQHRTASASASAEQARGQREAGSSAVTRAPPSRGASSSSIETERTLNRSTRTIPSAAAVPAAAGTLNSSSSSSETEREMTDHETTLKRLSTTQQPKLKRPTVPPYIDSRPAIKAYFKLYNPVNGGRMMNVYETKPATFSTVHVPGWESDSTFMQDPPETDSGDGAAGSGEQRWLDSQTASFGAGESVSMGTFWTDPDPDDEDGLGELGLEHDVIGNPDGTYDFGTGNGAGNDYMNHMAYHGNSVHDSASPSSSSAAAAAAAMAWSGSSPSPAGMHRAGDGYGHNSGHNSGQASAAGTGHGLRTTSGGSLKFMVVVGVV